MVRKGKGGNIGGKITNQFRDVDELIRQKAMQMSMLMEEERGE
jgi:hypothetical protein